MKLTPIFSLRVAIVVALGAAGASGFSACLGQHSGHLQTAALATFFGGMIHEIRDLDRPLHGARVDQIPLLQLHSLGEREPVGR